MYGVKMSKVQERIDYLQALMNAEQAGDNCQTYIDDLQLSIERLQNTQPIKEYVMVN